MTLDDCAKDLIDGMSPDRRSFLLKTAGLVAAASIGIFPTNADCSLQISNDYSRRNKSRKRRKHTEYIILHTTEAPDRSSVNMLKKYGLANYTVLTNGKIKRIVDKNKIARHAGRSLWEGRKNLDNWSIGIEVVGYHNKPLKKTQIKSIRSLLDDLQRIYKIPDKKVIPHSMVAYGKPNRWHPYNHRGRKRCGMLFANPSLRKELGLGLAPNSDPDVHAGRLRVADPYLNNILFGKTKVLPIDIGDTITKAISAWTIARDQYNAPTTHYTFPNGKVFSGDEIIDWGTLPKGTKVALNIGEKALDDIEYFQKFTGNETGWAVAGKEYNAASTIYFLTDGRVRKGNELSKKFLDHIPRKTEVLVGYTYGGKITKDRSASRIAGTKWDDPSTFYRLPDGKIITGEDINPQKIPKKTIVFYRNGN